MRAVDSEEAPQQFRPEPTYQLSVQNLTSPPDLEQRGHSPRAGNRPRLYATAGVGVIVFMTLSFGLYGPQYFK